jgi:hypothetical protein
VLWGLQDVDKEWGPRHHCPGPKHQTSKSGLQQDRWECDSSSEVARGARMTEGCEPARVPMVVVMYAGGTGMSRGRKSVMGESRAHTT